MSVLDAFRQKPTEIDKDVQQRLSKGRARHALWKPTWGETLAFIEGRQFVFRTRAATATSLNELDTSEGGMKPHYRARLVDNRVLGYWATEVSQGTQRVPQYGVTPTSTDPEVINAAKLGEKVLQYLYQFLKVRERMVEAYGYAVSCGEGFLRPYWNGYAGDQLPPDPENPEETLYTGELCLESYGPQEVFWEPGVRFEKSLWHAIESTKTIDEVKRLPGFTGVELKADANANQSFVQGQLNKTAAKGDVLIVTEYLELPSKDYPKGRRLFIANNQQVVEPENYPLLIDGPDGHEPCLVKLTFFPTPWRDRDMGMTEHQLDSQRTLNDSKNKAVEWKNLALAPQVLAPEGMFEQQQRLTTEPGAIVKYNPVAGQKPEIRDVKPIPDSLFRMVEQAVESMEEVASQRNLPPQIEAGKAITAFNERDATRRAYILQMLADAHSQLGSHLLLYVQQHWNEPRLLTIEGRHGADYIDDFYGAKLKQQASVRVLPGSIEPRTRASVEQKIMNLAQIGWIGKEEGLAAMEDGTADELVEDYELNVQKQYREIQQMIALANSLPGAKVPVAMEFDNHPLHRQILHRWMLTKEFEESPPPVQEAATLHDQQHKQFEDQQAAEAAAQQQAQAAQLGMTNATRPPGPDSMPSLPSTGNGSQTSGP